MTRIVERCTKCVLSSDFPHIKFDDQGVCSFCNNELFYTTGSEQINAARIEINNLINQVRGKSEYDAIMCYSGGKDSTYSLKLAVEKYNLKVLSFTLDNGFICPMAFKNIERVVNKLGVDHITFRPSYKFLKKLFRFTSLESTCNPKTLIRISANCNACISIVNITALKYALEKDIPFILAGFTLGQIPSNTIYYQNDYRFFCDCRKPILDKFKAALGIDVARYMEISDSLLTRSVAIPYNFNLLTLEDITENEIIEQILPLGWIKPEGLDGCSTNCMLNAFNNYIHEIKHGYNPYELELSHLIRKNLLSRQEAIGKLNDQPHAQIDYVFKELEIDPELIRDQHGILSNEI